MCTDARIQTAAYSTVLFRHHARKNPGFPASRTHLLKKYDSGRSRTTSHPVVSLKPSCSVPSSAAGGGGGMEAAGTDTGGREFRNAREMWMEEIGGVGEQKLPADQSPADADGGGSKRDDWYHHGIAYWEGVDASVDGVLGGYGHVDGTDVKGSQDFLVPLLAERFGADVSKRNLVALDCGSGIGRVTKNLLLKHFNEVDLVEPVSHFLDTARKNLSPENSMSNDSHMAVNFYCTPLQEFTPETGRYDVIWVQWCIGALPDDDFIAFFKRAKAGLKPSGFFVLKENVARSGFVLDKEDHSVTRSDSYFKELFQQCGLHVYKTKDQKGLPQELFPVKMYALVTSKSRVHGRMSRAQNRMPAVIKS